MFSLARADAGPVQPVQMGTIEAPRHTLYERLHVLGLPIDVINLVLKTTYKTRNGQEFPLFAIAQSSSDPTGYSWNFPEIIEIVHVFDQMKDAPVGDVERADPTSFARARLANATNLFKTHLEALALNREKNERLGTLVADHTVFEAPAMEEMRKQEVMKDLLMNRKRIPLKGKKCPRCRQEEVYQTALFTRSGDEPAVLHNVCGKCDALWKE